jgi:hypothetical protein
MFDFAVRTCKEQLSTGKNQMLMSKGVKVRSETRPPPSDQLWRKYLFTLLILFLRFCFFHRAFLVPAVVKKLPAQAPF